MFDLKQCQSEMDKVIEFFQQAMKSVRTGRAQASMLDNVRVEVYGTQMPLNQVANVVVADAQMLTITPFDANNLQAIATAIRNDQSLGLNPSDDGRLVRVPIPALTTERRLEIVKQASEKVEEAKIRVRNVRQDALKDIKKLKDDKQISEDDARRFEKDIQDLVNKTQEQIEALFKQKEQEITTI